MDPFSLHDGYLCKNSRTGLRHKMDMSELDTATQQRVVGTLNARKGDLKIVKYATTSLKTYFIANHAYLERLEDGTVLVRELPSTITPSSAVCWNHTCC